MRPWTRVEAVRQPQEVGGRLRRAADARELRDLPGLDAQFVEALDDALGDGVVAAARAQRGLAALVIQDLQPDAVDLLGRRRVTVVLIIALLADRFRRSRCARRAAGRRSSGCCAAWRDRPASNSRRISASNCAVAVLVDHVDAVVPADELHQFVGERIRPQPQVAGFDVVLALQLVAALAHRVSRTCRTRRSRSCAFSSSRPPAAGTCLRMTSNLCARRSMLLM